METIKRSSNRPSAESGRELETPQMSTSPTPIQQDDITERLLHFETPHYGSLPVNRTESINVPPQKRFRLPFLILLVFEWAVVVFLSVIVYAEVRAGVK